MVLKQNININENGFLFDADTGDSYKVNTTAVEIMKLLKEGKSEAEIREVILSKFQVDELVFERNYFEFTSLLKHMHLITE